LHIDPPLQLSHARAQAVHESSANGSQAFSATRVDC
jgi:hypothetical protein